MMLANPICNGSPTADNGPEGVPVFSHFGYSIKFGRNHAGWVHFSVDVVIVFSLDFDVTKCLGKFVFKFVGRVLWKGLVCVGVS